MHTPNRLSPYRILTPLMCGLIVLGLSSLGHAASSAKNTLSRREAESGWKLLFDGKSFAGWRGLGRPDLPDVGWSIEDGCIKHRAGDGAFGKDGDLITDAEYENFDLRWEWKIGVGANSGIKYGVQDNKPGAHSALGMEYQMLDDDRNGDGKFPKHVTGSLYDVIAPSQKVVRPVGEFNSSRILASGSHVEHWLNGVKIVEFDLRSEPFRELIAQSKYRSVPGFATSARGHIALQDHGGEVYFRDLKLRPLTPPAN